MKTYEQYLERLNDNLINALRGKYDGEYPTIEDKREYLKLKRPEVDFMVDIFEDVTVIAEYRIVIAREKSEVGENE